MKRVAVFSFVGFLLASIVCAIWFLLPMKKLPGREFDPVIENKRRQINREIARSNDHPWAGEYQVAGIDSSTELTLAPENGYVLRRFHGPSELCYLHGTVSWDGKIIRLSTPDVPSRHPLEYYPVRWGERRYLIPINSIIEFCIDVNTRSEPRRDVIGGFLLRSGDVKREARGKPEVPEEFKAYLLDKPVDATIISMPISVSTEETQEFSRRRGREITIEGRTFRDREIITVVLDKGREGGLLPGMRLFAEERGEIYGYSSVVLTNVDETQSEGVISFFFPDEPPHVGKRFSTYPEWMARIHGGGLLPRILSN